MNETHITLVGNIATDVRSTTSQSGVPITSFRVASTTRRFERGRGWADLDTLFVTVLCWRQLAENTAASFAKGDPVVVSGRVRMRQWTSDDGRSGTAFELEAVAAGHDLSRGVSSFTRSQPRAERVTRSEADVLAEAVAREPMSEGEDSQAAVPPADGAEPAEPVEPAEGVAADARGGTRGGAAGGTPGARRGRVPVSSAA